MIRCFCFCFFFMGNKWPLDDRKQRDDITPKYSKITFDITLKTGWRNLLFTYYSLSYSPKSYRNIYANMYTNCAECCASLHGGSKRLIFLLLLAM